MYRNQTNLREVVKARPLNVQRPDPYDADAEEKLRKRCPDCKRFHLRPGYCQARDPINKEKYPETWGKQ
jgi:hypothetical protein